MLALQGDLVAELKQLGLIANLREVQVFVCVMVHCFPHLLRYLLSDAEKQGAGQHFDFD